MRNKNLPVSNSLEEGTFKNQRDFEMTYHVCLWTVPLPLGLFYKLKLLINLLTLKKSNSPDMLMI